MIFIYGNTSKNTFNVNIPHRVYGKPNPIKHWRKQYNNNSNSKQISIDQSITYTNSNECVGLTQEVITSPECLGIKNNNKCIGGKGNVKRGGTTVVNKNYYSSRNNYLKSRNKTFEQNQSKGEYIKENTYTISNSNKELCSGQPKGMVYKPSNPAFNTQGSVQASANILRKRNSVCIECNKTLKNYNCSCVSSNGYYNKININL